jgi:hypothetical protein
MVFHDVRPTPETWASGEAQKYGWEHLVNSSGVYGAYYHIDIARHAIPDARTRKLVASLEEMIAEDGSVVLPTGVIPAADVIIGNAMKENGQISTDAEASDMGMRVGIYVLSPLVEIG